MSANAWEVLFVVTVSLMRNTALVDLLNLCLRTKTLGKNGGIKNEILRLLLFMH